MSPSWTHLERVLAGFEWGYNGNRGQKTAERQSINHLIRQHIKVLSDFGFDTGFALEFVCLPEESVDGDDDAAVQHASIADYGVDSGDGSEEEEEENEYPLGYANMKAAERDLIYD